jgi:dTMP kinase
VPDTSKRPSPRGYFITLEGGEGAGKSTQVAALAEALRNFGHEVIATREPGGAPGADVLRGLLLSGEVAWSSQAETLLHFAARAEHIAHTIRPALARGAIVLCDRYYDSTMVYQGHALGGDRAQIAELSRMMDLVPDLTLVLDVSVQTTATRLASRGLAADRYERLGTEFFARIRDGFDMVVADNPDRCVRISGEADQASVQAALLKAVLTRFPDIT